MFQQNEVLVNRERRYGGGRTGENVEPQGQGLYSTRGAPVKTKGDRYVANPDQPGEDEAERTDSPKIKVFDEGGEK